MDWTESSYPEDAIYTREWTIKEFSKAMERTDGQIDSPPFKLPGLQWSFFLRVTRSQCDRKKVSIENQLWSLSDINRYNRYYGHARHDDEDFISHLFDVWLLVKNPSDDANKLKLAGTLEVSQSTREFRPKGHFFNDDGYDHGYTHDTYFLPAAGSGVASISVGDLGSRGWQFAREIPSRPDVVVLPWDLECVDFYALNNTPELTLKSSAIMNDPSEERVPFKHLLQQTEFSDVTLKIGDREFPCHRLILANRSPVFKRMLTADMLEARTREVEIEDIEVETMEKLLEFLYSGEIEVMGDQLENLFYAADKYAVMGLFKICINLFGENDVTPSNAVDILLIADRHSHDRPLRKLKKRVFAWIKAERQRYMDDAIFTREMKRHPELMAELNVEAVWGPDDI